MLLDLTTRKWGELANATAGWPSWTRDGEYIYFRRLGNDPAVFRVRIDNRNVERVVGLKDFRQAWGSFPSGWLGLAPDDSPLLLRDAGTQEIYALEWEAP
jgi:hypothetical protein